MDFEQNNNQSEPTPGKAIIEPTSQPVRTGAGWRIFWGIALALSIMANIALIFILIGVVTVFSTGQRDTLLEELIQKGPRRNKMRNCNHKQKSWERFWGDSRRAAGVNPLFLLLFPRLLNGQGRVHCFWELEIDKQRTELTLIPLQESRAYCRYSSCSLPLA